MNREEIFAKVQDIFRDIFDDESLIINDATNADDIDEWDSLNHINLVNAIEKEYSIKFALGELELLKDVGAMVDMMIKKIK
jgi:acyl carrier protein